VHACALKTDRSLWCWGSNISGQLGLGDDVDRSAPSRVGDATWAWVALGEETTCAIRSDTTLWCWGANRRGQLGLGPVAPSTVTVPMQPLSSIGRTWAFIAMGIAHGCALTDEGALWCWGANEHGQLGLGDNTPRTELTRVGTSTFVDVAAGERFTVAVDPTGAVWSAGEQPNGVALKLGDTVDPGPHLLLSAGRLHDCAITDAQQIRCRGEGPAVGPTGGSTTYVEVAAF
jgi:alpha-tubulin suppressor-like RCC1 family protein